MGMRMPTGFDRIADTLAQRLNHPASTEAGASEGREPSGVVGAEGSSDGGAGTRTLPGTFADLLAADRIASAEMTGPPAAVGARPEAAPQSAAMPMDASSAAVEFMQASAEVALAEPPGATTPSSAPFDLPTFLRVLPRSGAGVAVAAAREPGMADAVRRLPPPPDPPEVKGASKSMPDAALPAFLLPAGESDDRSGSLPARASPDGSASDAPTVTATGAALSAPNARDGGAARLEAAIINRTGLRTETRAEPRSGSVDASEPRATRTDGKPTREVPNPATRRSQGLPRDVAPETPRLTRDEVVASVLRAAAVTRPSAALSASVQGASAPGAVLPSPEAGAGTPAAASPDATSFLDLTPSDGLLQPVGTEAWQDELSAQLSMMAERGGERSEAVMKLAPEGLGELEIRLETQGAEVSVQFGAANAEARQALEQAQARLRDALGQQGVRLSEFSVFSHLSDNPQAKSNDRERRGVTSFGQSTRAAEAVIELNAVVSPRRKSGGVDLYA